MSETWVIKDTAPVDENDYELAKTSIAFRSAGQEFTAFEVPTDGVAIWLHYYISENLVKEVASFEPGLGESAFYWTIDDAYKTVVFDTAPTGDLLAWLQKNADKQVVDYLTNDADLKAVADAIREKGGTSAPLTYPDGFVSAIGAINSANYRRFEGTIESTVTGSGAEVLLVEDEIIGQVSGLDSLLVRLSTDASEEDAYTLVSCVATNLTHVIAETNTQFMHRIGATAGASADRGAIQRITVNANLAVGQLRIVGNQLRWVVNSTNYAARPCNYVVEVMW